jgi:hypothetical protein
VNDAQPVNMSQPFKDLTEKSPYLCRVLVKVPGDEIPKSLLILVSKLLSTGCC